MSADNGIYIAQFPDGYRVCHGQAIENIDYFPEGAAERKDVLKDYFGQSPIFDTLSKAQEYAQQLEDEYEWTEYGICFMGKYESFETVSSNLHIAKIYSTLNNIEETINQKKYLDTLQHIFNLRSEALELSADVESLIKHSTK
jgi:hypothetical protein